MRLTARSRRLLMEGTESGKSNSLKRRRLPPRSLPKSRLGIRVRAHHLLRYQQSLLSQR